MYRVDGQALAPYIAVTFPFALPVQIHYLQLHFLDHHRNASRKGCEHHLRLPLT
jgi:hypothetical protein